MLGLKKLWSLKFKKKQTLDVFGHKMDKIADYLDVGDEGGKVRKQE